MTDLHSHVFAVDVLDRHGCPPPESWQQLRTRYARFLELDGARAATEQLAAAVINGADEASMPLLYACALAERGARGAVSDVRQQIGAQVHGRLTELYRPVAARTYKAVAGEFNDAAQALTAAAKAVDVEAPDSAIVSAGDRARRAWLDAPGLAERLDEIAGALAAAAALCGAPAGLLALEPGTAEPLRLALVVDDKGLHRRRIWECYEAGGRTGRWGPQIALGARVRAHPDPATLQAYRQPGPTGIAFELGPDGGHRPIAYDPEDPQNAAAVRVGDADWSVA